MGKKVLIVGGVAAGASTAARLRRLDEDAHIVLFEKDGYISFANCGMPYYIGGAIPDREDLLVQTPEMMRKRFRIDVRIFSRVAGVDTDAKSVHVVSREKGEYDESYDVLVLCPGAEPIRLNTDDDAADKVFSLRNIDDVDRIKARIDQGGDVAHAVVIGGGFVGLEMAENLRERGIEVTLVEAMPQILAPFDPEMAEIAQKTLQKHGVALRLGTGVEKIEKNGSGISVRLSGGDAIPADMVISAVGVRPATAFLQGSKIELGPKGHIVTDAHMRTNIGDVYAAGDAVQVRDFVTGQPTGVPLAGPANKQGRIVADNIAGLNHTYGGAQGTAIIKLFNLTAAATGANERTLKRAGIAYHAIYTHPYSHAGYYPGATQFTAKLLFHDDGRILGCQMVGKDGVDKRLDVVAAAMRLGAHVTQLVELELAYAPPYSSAKDPVNMLGYVAENMLEGMSDLITWEEALRLYEAGGAMLLDVRTEGEFSRGHVGGAINIPVDELRERLDELDKSKTIIEYCQVGVRAHTAQRLLVQKGFRVLSVTGGYKSCPSAK